MSTLATITTNVRLYLKDQNKQFWPLDSELYFHIGAAYRFYFQAMTKQGSGYFTDKTFLDLVANTETIDLSLLSPSFYRIAKLERCTPIGTIPLDPSERRLQINSPYLAGAGWLYQPTYRMRGKQILVLEPEPMISETGSKTSGLRLEFVYQPVFPSTSSSSSFQFDASFPTVFENIIELKASILALASMDAIGGVSDATTLIELLSSLEAQFYDSLEQDENPQKIPYVGSDYSNQGY